MKKIILTLYCCLFFASFLFAENGYDLWLRYNKIEDNALLNQYQQQITNVIIEGNSPTIGAVKEELQRGFNGLFENSKFKIQNSKFDAQLAANSLLISTPAESTLIASLNLAQQLASAGKEGFIILSTTIQNKPCTIITANTHIGLLYGTFHFLQLLQTHQSISRLNISSAPKIQNRVLNHWDNLNRTVERGYAGFSIWNWHLLPDYIDPRYKDYARANASIGINGVVLTNVNANASVLTAEYLKKVAALANVFRPYGIKVYLTARFSAPIEIGKLSTADPLNADVREWWKNKTDEIYQAIPDFGGFLVKANSEGQPGPQNYNRTHADGANMLAQALQPHNGIVMWRAFVYSNETPEDRFKQAYNDFKPLDGQFEKNVLIQVKNGPIDFQPREPFHPLFGAMPKTPVMAEFQLTQEYLGFASHLVYLAPLFKECLDADTYTQGKGSTVKKIISGEQNHHSISGIAGVANIGNDINWCGHPFAQANWYAFGKLAWNPDASSQQIANDWIRMTLTNDNAAVDSIKNMMILSREAVVDYMTPLGLHHIMGYGAHYGPAPWYNKAPRADWNPVYFHKADSLGLGFDRADKGSNALSQYSTEVKNYYSNLSTCPDEYLLWFHHANWNYKMHSGRTLWHELCYRYNKGVEEVRSMQYSWNKMQGKIDEQRFDQVSMLLSIQEKEAVWWRDACLSYFATFSKQSIPANYEQPKHSLEYYEKLHFPYAPNF